MRSFPSYQCQRNFPGPYYAACMGRHVGFESLERDHLMMLDFSPMARSFAAQPFWLSWSSGGKTRRHVPDFFVRQADGRGVVVDVRPDGRIKSVDAEAFTATAERARRWGGAIAAWVSLIQCGGQCALAGRVSACSVSAGAVSRPAGGGVCPASSNAQSRLQRSVTHG